MTDRPPASGEPCTERKYGWHEGRAFHAGKREDCRTCDKAEARATPPTLDVDRLRQDLREALQYAGSSRLASDKIRSVLARLAEQEPK